MIWEHKSTAQSFYPLTLWHLPQLTLFILPNKYARSDNWHNRKDSMVSRSKKLKINTFFSNMVGMNVAKASPWNWVTSLWQQFSGKITQCPTLLFVLYIVHGKFKIQWKHKSSKFSIYYELKDAYLNIFCLQMNWQLKCIAMYCYQIRLLTVMSHLSVSDWQGYCCKWVWALKTPRRALRLKIPAELLLGSASQED